MKEFWKKSAASLMAMSLLMGNNYAIHALDGEDAETAGGNSAEGVSEPGYTIRGLLVSGETAIGDPVTINPAEFTEQKSIGEVAPEIDGYSFGNAYITREGNSDTVLSLGGASYITDSGEEILYKDVSNEEHVVETVFSYSLSEDNTVTEEGKTESTDGKTDEVTPEEATINEDSADTGMMKVQLNAKKNAPLLRATNALNVNISLYNYDDMIFHH